MKKSNLGLIIVLYLPRISRKMVLFRVVVVVVQIIINATF